MFAFDLHLFYLFYRASFLREGESNLVSIGFPCAAYVTCRNTRQRYSMERTYQMGAIPRGMPNKMSPSG